MIGLKPQPSRRGSFQTETGFEASDATDLVIGELSGRSASGRISFEEAPAGGATCKTPDPSGVAFTARHGRAR